MLSSIFLHFRLNVLKQAPKEFPGKTSKDDPNVRVLANDGQAADKKKGGDEDNL